MTLRATCLLFCVFLMPFFPLKATTPIHDIPADFAENALYADSLLMMMNTLLNDFPEFTDEDYKARLRAISGKIDYRLDPLVKERIIVRTEKYRESTEKLLGKSDMYFPIFEEHLCKYNVPHHLKYLAIVESHLNPVAKSVASAVGLWQFIPSSGRLFGLKINSYVDERSDTYKASDAAARLLSTLYEKYGDWALSMAAYNCGPGRVDKAIKRAGGSKNYWKVRNYLPRETQRYVPFFMAMVYVGEFHTHHELKPLKMPQSLVLTDTIHLEGGLSLKNLAEELDMSMDTLKLLNPAYRRNYIPKAKTFQTIVLPATVVAQLRGYQNALKRVMKLQKENPIKVLRRIRHSKDLEWLAKVHRCKVEDILYWNALPANYSPYRGDLIAIRKYAAPKDQLKKQQRGIEAIAIASLKVVAIDENKAQTARVYLPMQQRKDIVSVASNRSRMPAMSRNNNRQPAAATAAAATASNPAAKVNTANVPKANDYGKRPQVAIQAASSMDNRDRSRRFRNYGSVAEQHKKEETPAGNLESSYSDQEATLVDYDALQPITQNPLIPADKRQDLPKGRDLLMGSAPATAAPDAATAARPNNSKVKIGLLQEGTATANPPASTQRRIKIIDNSSPDAETQELKDKATEQVLQNRSRERKIRSSVKSNNSGTSFNPAPKQEIQLEPSVQKAQSSSPESKKIKYHTVKEGESIWDIQARYPMLTTQEILDNNQLKAGQPLRAGQILKLTK